MTWLLRLKEVNIRPPLASEEKYQRGRRKLPERPKRLPRNFPITISSEYISVRDTTYSHTFLQSIKDIEFMTELLFSVPEQRNLEIAESDRRLGMFEKNGALYTLVPTD